MRNEERRYYSVKLKYLEIIKILQKLFSVCSIFFRFSGWFSPSVPSEHLNSNYEYEFDSEDMKLNLSEVLLCNGKSLRVLGN